MNLGRRSVLHLSIIYIASALCLIVWINRKMKEQALHHAEPVALSVYQRNMALHPAVGHSADSPADSFMSSGIGPAVSVELPTS